MIAAGQDLSDADDRPMRSGLRSRPSPACARILRIASGANEAVFLGVMRHMNESTLGAFAVDSDDDAVVDFDLLGPASELAVDAVEVTGDVG